MEFIQKQLEANKVERAKILLKKLFRFACLNLVIEGFVLRQGKPTHVKIEAFLNDTQQNTKKFVSVVNT